MDGSETGLTSWTADIVSAYVAHNAISGDKLPDFIGSVYAALSKATTQGAEPPAEELKPAVPVKKSVFADHLVCLACAKHFKTLKRHLRTDHQLTPEHYRERYELPRSYPIIAPNYTKARSAIAKKIGLGRGGQKAATKTIGRKRA